MRFKGGGGIENDDGIGSITRLRGVCNASESQWRLLLMWLAGCMLNLSFLFFLFFSSDSRASSPRAVDGTGRCCAVSGIPACA